MTPERIEMIVLEHREDNWMLVKIENWNEAEMLKEAGALTQDDWEDWVDCACGHGGTDKISINVKVTLKEGS